MDINPSWFPGCHIILCAFCNMEITELAQVLTALGCPAGKSAAMAAQLDKRARQLAAEKGRSHAEALKHLLALMQQGWAANPGPLHQQSPPPPA
jgi:hypothetical protein